MPVQTMQNPYQQMSHRLIEAKAYFQELGHYLCGVQFNGCIRINTNNQNQLRALQCLREVGKKEIPAILFIFWQIPAVDGVFPFGHESWFASRDAIA